MFPSLSFWTPLTPPPLHKGSSEQYISAQKNIVFPYVKSPFPFPSACVWAAASNVAQDQSKCQLGHSRIGTSRNSSRAPSIEVRGQESLRWNTLCVWGVRWTWLYRFNKGESGRWNKMKDERERKIKREERERKSGERQRERERERQSVCACLCACVSPFSFLKHLTF